MSSQRYSQCLGLVMRAIRFEVFGDPSVLELTEVPAPAADEKTAVVRVMAASINPSDTKNVAGGINKRHCRVSPAGISPASVAAPIRRSRYERILATRPK
jgi:hypothetical protein